jgi:flagellin-like protein
MNLIYDFKRALVQDLKLIKWTKGRKEIIMRRITQVRRSVRAISPVIATLLMIAIAVVASLVVYA